MNSSWVTNAGGRGTLLAGVVFIALQLGVFGVLWNALASLKHTSEMSVLHLEASASLERVNGAVAEVLVTSGSSDSLKSLRDGMKAFGTANSRLSANVDHWERAKTTWPEMEAPLQTLLAASDRSTENVEAMVAYGKFTRMAQAVSQALREDTVEFEAGFDRDKKRAVMAVLAAVAICLAGTLAIFSMFYVRVTRPLRAALNVAENVAQGDLSKAVNLGNAGELTSLMRALATMQQSLAGLVHQVQTATGTVASAAQQVSAASVDLSARTEEQASTLEETASSLEEFTATVRQTADNTRKASSLAAQATASAVASASVVNDAVETMAGIESGSKKIGEIVNVIDGIAFQTNILALNAAVEAARAGEHGRGFAVVAAEVRALAHRSAASAKEIKQLIAASVGQISEGTRLVNDAGQSMQQIRSSIADVDALIQDIARAAAEQAHGVEQVNRAVVQMENVTQQNASMVQQAAASADSMNEEAQGLRALVSRFALADSVARDSSAAAAAGRDASDTAAVAPVRIGAANERRLSGTSAPRLTQPQGSSRSSGARSAKAGRSEWEEF